MKQYIIKVYNLDGTFKTRINDNEILSDISFNENINSGQSGLDILLNKAYNNTDIEKSDFVKVTMYDETFTSGKLVYTGIIEEINRIYGASENKVSLQCRGLSSLLTRIMYFSGSYTFNKTDDPGTIITDVINYFNTVYTGGWLNTSGIQTTGTTIDIDFDYTDCLTALRNIQEATNYYFFIKEDGTVEFKPIPVTTTHYLTAGTEESDIQSIDITEDTSEIINKVIVDYDGGTYTTTDPTSISTYGQFDPTVYVRSDLKNLASATEFGDNELARNKDPKQKVQIEVNTRYTLENIKPGDTVKVRGLDYEIKDSQIQKTGYSSKTSIIYLQEFDSVGQILTK